MNAEHLTHNIYICYKALRQWSGLPSFRINHSRLVSPKSFLIRNNYGGFIANNNYFAILIHSSLPQSSAISATLNPMSFLYNTDHRITRPRNINPKQANKGLLCKALCPYPLHELLRPVRPISISQSSVNPFLHPAPRNGVLSDDDDDDECPFLKLSVKRRGV